uniref:hypothetical protein n=1 Tax=Rappaport israeli TaxID=1839807 RepID=UPI000AAE9EEE
SPTITNVKPAKPELYLPNDTFGTGTKGTNKDRLTKDATIKARGIEDNATFEYQIEGLEAGKSGLLTGTIAQLNQAIKNDPNKALTGKDYTIKAKRIVNGEKSGEATLEFTYDKVAPSTDRLVVNLKNGKYVLLGETDEPGSKVELAGHGSTIADAKGKFELDLGNKLQTSQSTLTVTDEAGNSNSELVNIGVYRNINNTPNKTPFEIVRGNTTGRADIFYAEGYTTNPHTLNLGRGNDTLAITNGGVYSTAPKGKPGIVNMGDGNDTISAKYITGIQNIFMGKGDDKIILNSQWLGHSIGRASKVDLGPGNDTVEMYNTVGGGDHIIGFPELNGGAGYDRLIINTKDKLDGSGEKHKNAANREQNMWYMKNMEEVDLSKSGRDTLKISLNDLKKNHDATHKRLIIKGDSADTIDFGEGLGNPKRPADKVDTIDGKSYNVYTYTSSGVQYHLYIDQEIPSKSII